MDNDFNKQKFQKELNDQLKDTYINGIMIGFKTAMEMIKSYCDSHNNEEVKKFVEKNLNNKNLKVMKNIIKKKK